MHNNVYIARDPFQPYNKNIMDMDNSVLKNELFGKNLSKPWKE